MLSIGKGASCKFAESAINFANGKLKLILHRTILVKQEEKHGVPGGY